MSPRGKSGTRRGAGGLQRFCDRMGGDKGVRPRVAETGERRCGRKSYDRDWVDRTSLRWQERKGRREIKIITGLRRGERDKDCPCGG
jgi:hypothetical protein